MNVYDFDYTVFTPDSSACFLRFCLRHHTRAVLKALLFSADEAIRYLATGKKDAKRLKEALFSFLNRVDNIEAIVDEFWECHIDHLQSWYLEQKQPDDLIISASPEFLLRPITDRLGVTLMATRMNPWTGQIKGKNCHDEEKVRRFLEVYPADSVDRFYSDSLCDIPMARMADEAFLVVNGRVFPWPINGSKKTKPSP
ncbi:MAG: haloacid dehalogenase-like hydrolase [Oscillospiraceae bacterium]|nr:haloacid dehalogenase-like hydrolase [Oscillospiraceae bacterium]